MKPEGKRERERGEMRIQLGVLIKGKADTEEKSGRGGQERNRRFI